MQSSRRNLLLMSFAAAPGVLMRLQDSGLQERTRGRPRADGPDDPTNNPNAANLPGSSPKVMLEERQKSIKKDVERLYDLAAQLKTEVEKTDSTTILSLAMLKKAEEIEKLAKQIKDHAKG
jgi:sugar-specific transcriptional regulator TrmB